MSDAEAKPRDRRTRRRRDRVLRGAAKALKRPARRLVSSSKKTGLTPGSVVYTGAQKVDAVSVDVLRYGPESLDEAHGLDLDAALERLDGEGVTWLNVTGLHETEVIERVGTRFGLHPLTLEDVVSIGQRPKMEVFDDYVYVVLRMLSRDGDHVADEQLSVILGRDIVITFQERPGDIFEPLRERIRKAKGRIRGMGPDYLAYAILDIVVDNYFVVLESYSDLLDEIEGEVYHDPRPAVMERISALKQEALHVRKAVWPVRELMAALLREESELFSRPVQTFLRDAYDHVIQAIDALETLREILGGLQDAYLSSLSFRMNEVMKVLTMIATIFIPLTFLAGIYGMNFEHMPELGWRWAYPALLGSMIVVAVAMFFWFRRKNWL